MTSFWRAFQELIPLGIVVALIMLCVAIAWRRLGRLGRRRAAVAFTVAWALAALAVTLRPQPDMTDAHGNPRSRWLDLKPFAEIHDSLFNSVSWHVAVEQLAGNVVLFFPLGVALAMLHERRQRRWISGFVAGALAGVVIESAQWVLGVGRVSSVDDVLLATLGSGLGYLVTRPLLMAVAASPVRAATAPLDRTY